MIKRMVSQPHRLRIALLVLAILIAIFFRLYQIDTIPPGDKYDPAYYGVDALHILEGERPIFFSTNFGREALFSYLVAIYIALFGISSQAMYVTSAVVGILTVPAVYLLAEELFAEEEGTLRQFGGPLAALAVAISYWHLNWSRFGVRAILVPLVSALTFYFLWRALRTESRLHFVAAGFFLGLGMYTYQVARLYPALVVLAFVYVAFSRRTLTRRDLIHLAIVSLVALLVFGPLGAYFITHPGSFSQRIEQAAVVSSSQDLLSNLQAIGTGIVDMLLFFAVRGDLEPTTNLPERPSLNGFLSILFFVGVFISLLRGKRPAYLFIITWLVVMSVPAILSQYAPIAKRAIGTLPAVVVLIAIGALVPVDRLRNWAANRQSYSARAAAVALGVVILAGFGFTAARTYYDYFVVWATDQDMFTHFDVGPTAIGQYVGTLPPEEEVYISPVPFDHPSVVYNSQNRPGVKGYDGHTCLVVPERSITETTFVIVPSEDPNSFDLLHTYFPQGEVVAKGPLYYQQPYFLAYQIPKGSTAKVAPSYPLEVNWENKIRLLGYDVDAKLYRPGDTIHLTLYFQTLEQMDADYTVFAHLLGPDNPASGSPLWGQDDSEPCRRSYPTSLWTPGEIVRDKLVIVIPNDAPSGDYQVRVGFYLLETMTRLPATDIAGLSIPDDAALLQQLRVEIGDENELHSSSKESSHKLHATSSKSPPLFATIE